MLAVRDDCSESPERSLAGGTVQLRLGHRSLKQPLLPQQLPTALAHVGCELAKLVEGTGRQTRTFRRTFVEGWLLHRFSDRPETTVM